MEPIQYVKATDTLRIHFTTMDRIYKVQEMDDECYKILDNRGVENWVPFRYFAPSTEAEYEAQEAARSTEA